MSHITYEQAYEDRQYLWNTYGAAAGAYVDQEDLEALFRSPTKVTARRCLINQIAYWFQTGPEDASRVDRNDPVLLQIKDRYHEEFWW